MSIVLSILQILGWTLLIVFLLVILLLLILLFCPLRYLLEVEWKDEKWARLKAHWLFRLIRAKLSYGDDLLYGEVHLLWKKISFSHDFSKKEDENFEDIDDDELEAYLDAELEEESVAETVSEEKIIGTESAEELRGEVKLEEDVTDHVEDDSIEDNAVEDNVAEDEEEDNSIVSKIKGIINHIQEVYSRIKVILEDEQNQDAVKHIKNELIYLLKIFLPKKSKVNAVFSTGSPDTTGQLFGILALFPAMYYKNWNLAPDFHADEAYFKGNIWAKGWIALYQFVGIALRILFDKNCKKLYTMVNKFLKWMKNEDKPQEEK